MQNFQDHYSKVKTPQSQPIPGSTQTENNAGGYAWQVDIWQQLDRFLVLGTSGGTYYVTEQKLTIDNAEAVIACLKADPQRAVDRIVQISHEGRAAKNDPALFALALAASFPESAKYALSQLSKVARIGTHLFNFLTYVQHHRGWGRGLREAVAAWYTEKDVDKLAYQVVKYRQRDGWTHRDALRKAHPIAGDEQRNKLFKWITHSGFEPGLPEMVNGYLVMQGTTKPSDVVGVLRNFSGLPWETIPTDFLKDAKVWSALIPTLPLHALVRNLGRMTANGAITQLSDSAITVAGMLLNQDAIIKSRMHPIAVLSALVTYRQGHGTKGSLNWEPVPQISEALEKMFYASFQNVKPTGKRTMLALDVSGSMNFTAIPNLGITARDASACIAMATARVEPNYMFFGFSGQFIPLGITAQDSIQSAIQEISGLSFNRTDCSLPMLYALENNIPVDTFCVYTDSETWCGNMHPVQALRLYRKSTGIKAKLIVIAMTSSGFTIADPNDAGMLDIVGFDSACPRLIADFSANTE